MRLPKKKNSALLRTPDKFIRAIKPFTADEWRIMNLCLYRLKGYEYQFKQKYPDAQSIKARDSVFTFTADQIAQLLNISKETVRDQLRKAAIGLTEQAIKINPDSSNHGTILNIFAKADFDSNEISLKMTKDAVKLLLDNKHGYAETYLDQMNRLRSWYAMQLLNMISQFQHEASPKKRFYRTTLGRLEQVMQAYRHELREDGKRRYRQFSDFKKAVIEIPLKEIEKVSNGAWQPCGAPDKNGNPTYVEIKGQGRKYTNSDEVIFTMKYVGTPVNEEQLPVMAIDDDDDGLPLNDDDVIEGEFDDGVINFGGLDSELDDMLPTNEETELKELQKLEKDLIAAVEWAKQHPTTFEDIKNAESVLETSPKVRIIILSGFIERGAGTIEDVIELKELSKEINYKIPDHILKICDEIEA